MFTYATFLHFMIQLYRYVYNYSCRQKAFSIHTHTHQYFWMKYRIFNTHAKDAIYYWSHYKAKHITFKCTHIFKKIKIPNAFQKYKVRCLLVLFFAQIPLNNMEKIKIYRQKKKIIRAPESILCELKKGSMRSAMFCYYIERWCFRNVNN